MTYQSTRNLSEYVSGSTDSKWQNVKNKIFNLTSETPRETQELSMWLVNFNMMICGLKIEAKYEISFGENVPGS